MKWFYPALALATTLAASQLAQANVGAVTNRAKANIMFAVGEQSSAYLVREAMRGCMAIAPKKSDCVPAKNILGICEHTNASGYDYGVYGGMFDTDGVFQGYISCGSSYEEARTYLSASCERCHVVGNLYDDSSGN